MRPDPREQPDRDASGRIIYLGDVRRRKLSRRQAPDSDYLGATALLALAGWAVWAAVVFNVAPSKLLTYLAFFAPLAVALTATGTIVASLLERRRHSFVSWRVAFRRGAGFAAVVILNGAFLAAHRWSVVLIAVSVLAVIVADMVAGRHG